MIDRFFLNALRVRLPRATTTHDKVQRLIASVAITAVALGCQQASGNLKEWTPADHHNAKGAASATPTRQSTGQQDPSRQDGLDDVTLASWQQNCILCHGPLGRGDGQQGPLLGAKDLTAAAYQASVSDEQIALVIRQGRNKMPSFAHLPDSTVNNLVKLIRLLGAYVASAGRAVAAPSGAAGNAPHAAGLPPAASTPPAAPASASPASLGARPEGSAPEPSGQKVAAPKGSSNVPSPVAPSTPAGQYGP